MTKLARAALRSIRGADGERQEQQIDKAFAAERASRPMPVSTEIKRGEGVEYACIWFDQGGVRLDGRVPLGITSQTNITFKV